MNTPYRKIYENGILANPVTKDQPIRSYFENRKQRRKSLGRLFSNKSGIQLVVTNLGNGQFEKSRKNIVTFEGNKLENIKGKTIVTY